MAQRKKNKKNSYSERTDGFLAILFFLFTIYLAALGGIAAFLNKIASDSDIGIEKTFIQNYGGLILAAIASIIAIYLIFLTLIGIFELRTYFAKLNKKQERLRNVLRDFVLSTPAEILSGVLPLSAFTLVIPFYFFKSWIACTIFALYLIAFLVAIFNKNKIRDFLSSVFFNKPKRTCGLMVLVFFYLILILVIVLLMMNLVIFSYAKYDINLDKPFYIQGDAAYVTIYSEGLGSLRPITDSVTYSNMLLEFDYEMDKQFGQAPIYLIIPAENLTSKSFNSFLTVKYHLAYGNKIFRENMTQEIFIPVFPKYEENKSINYNNQTFYINNTYIENYYFN
ncbi:MAG: hypothetical protein ACP5N7_06175 [Candidatus Pacearchaeota archaeon]